MNRKIVGWAVAGFIVAALWTAAAKATGGWPNWSAIWLLVEITCPIALLRHHPMSVYSVLFINAATYAALGFNVELFRRMTVSPVPGPRVDAAVSGRPRAKLSGNGPDSA